MTKGPDPHWRWRGGSNEVATITFAVAQLTAEVSELRLSEGRLTYSLGTPEGGSCELFQQPDGRYEGECQRIFNGVLITLSPPDEDAPDEEEPAADQ